MRSTRRLPNLVYLTKIQKDSPHQVLENMLVIEEQQRSVESRASSDVPSSKKRMSVTKQRFVKARAGDGIFSSHKIFRDLALRLLNRLAKWWFTYAKSATPSSSWSMMKVLLPKH
jgi:hypothetical protein